MVDELEGDIVSFRSKREKKVDRYNVDNDIGNNINNINNNNRIFRQTNNSISNPDLIPDDIISPKQKIKKTDIRKLEEENIERENIEGENIDEKTEDGSKCEITGEIVSYKKAPILPGLPPGPPPPTDMSAIVKILQEHHAILKEIAKIEEDLKNFLIGYSATGTYFEIRTSTTVATLVQPITPDTVADASIPTPGYDFIDVNKQKQGKNAPRLWIINDGPPAPGVGDNLYVITSSDGKTFSPEFLMIVGETRLVNNVYEIRIRSPKAGDIVRITERETIVPYVTTVTNTLTPVSNRTAFITRRVPAPTATVFPIVTGGANLTGGASIPIPDSFSIAIRANVDNLGNGRVYVAFNQSDVNNFLNRITLAPGDEVRYTITDANLVWIAGELGSENVDWTAEQ